MNRILSRILNLEMILWYLTDLRGSYPYPIDSGLWTESKLTSEVEASKALYIEKDEQVQAFILYREIPDGFEISLLATHPEHQRKGLMAELMRGLIGQLGDSEKIWLEVHAKNEGAQAFYGSLGFVLEGQRKKYYSDGAAAFLFSFQKNLNL